MLLRCGALTSADSHVHWYHTPAPHVLHRVRTRQGAAARAVSAAADAVTSGGNESCLSLALKEWAVTCAALGKGDQTVILRKGGIREPTFKAAADSFLLFPTSFHSKANLLTPAANSSYQEELEAEPKQQHQLAINYLAAVTGCWTTFDPAVLAALSSHHVWTEEFLESRLRWRPKQPITVLELRCSALRQPLVVQNKDSYWGCFSWVDLEQGLEAQAMQTAQEVIGEDEFVKRQHGVRAALQTLNDCSEVLLPVR